MFRFLQLGSLWLGLCLEHACENSSEVLSESLVDIWTAFYVYFLIILCWGQAMVVFLLLATTGPPIKRRKGLRIKQAGRVLEDPKMEAFSIMKLFKSFCDYSHWNYAVFWKLSHHFPMTLTWEDGYCGDQKSNESTNSSAKNSVGLLMTEMSHLKYILGEGVVGKVALTGDHCWVSSEDLFTSKFCTNLIPECPYEWFLQCASAIKVAEDLEFVANVKEKFNSIHCMTSIPSRRNTTPSSLDKNLQDWSISALKDCLLDDLDESSSITNKILIDELSDDISHNINGLSRLNPTIPSFDQNEGFMSGKNKISRSTGVSNDVGQVQMKSDHMGEEIWGYSPWVKNVEVFGETSKGIFSYSCKDKAEQLEDHKSCNTVSSFFSFPLDSELHKALGPVASKQTVESTYSSSSTLISGKKEHDHIKDLQISKEGEAECLLDAVIGKLCSASDDSSSTWPIIFTSSIHPQSLSEESTLVTSNANTSSHLTSAFMDKDIDDRSDHFTSASLDGNLGVLFFNETQEEAIYSHKQSKSGQKLSGKKRARVVNTQRQRPRDRQLIMDRMKELRELVPDGAKCSIDNLLDRTVKHVLYLRKITDQAEKLKQCEQKELPEYKKQKIDGNHTGRSCAIDFGSELQVCPIVIEDLECSGHMLIEMICSENGLFLEIAQVIRQLELTILKGVLESRSSTVWARFIVEVPRGFHRMDVLCPLLHLLQQRRNLVTNRI
ncbi:transcription factor EMB1444-like [Senna tora]|uniref:Transcription factor EMB1444-like n=1 Tax=Senna tora TaxID=362788 RepID=A0A834TRK9_9FABA|nr:transcription factor EMB1444-like [Senna tora]